MVAYRTIVRGTGLAALGAALAATAPVLAQQVASEDESIVVTAQRENETQVIRQGSLGALGVQDAMEVPFSVQASRETLILHKQPLTLGAGLEHDPSLVPTLGFRTPSEPFVIRGFPPHSTATRR